MGTERKRLVMWHRIMLMRAAARNSHGNIDADQSPHVDREVPKPVAEHKPTRSS